MLKILTNLRKKEWGLVSIALLFVVTQVWLDLTLPEYMSEITMLVQTPGSLMPDIWRAGGRMLLCAILSLGASVIVAICAARVASNLSAILRHKIFNKVQSFSMEEMNRFSTASLMTRSTNDITQIQVLIVMGLQAIIKAPIMAVWAITKIADKSWQWTFSTGGAILLLMGIVGTCLALATPRFKRLPKLTDELNRVTREHLTGLSVVRAYNGQAYQHEKFEKANSQLTATNLFANRTMSFLLPGIQFVSNGLSLAIYWVGASLIQNAAMPAKMGLFSDMIVFTSYALQIIMSFMMLVMIFILLPRASVAAQRILEIFHTVPSIQDGTEEEGIAGLHGEIVFKHVSFKYPDAEEYVLKDINFSAHQGETVAFIGATGCGKSTLIHLIPRFYDVTEGEVLVNGRNVKAYRQYSLHNKMGYVSQKATLFSGTIASNVAYGESEEGILSEEAIRRAVDISQATEFVEKKEAQYESVVAQGGSNLSGGQKQRLSIARAISRKPEILIFDDSFSALDYKTDKTLRKALEKQCKKTTTLIVAQRIGTIKNADKIIVLEEGRIVGIGKHEALMATCEVYRQIAYSQLSKEELQHGL